MDQKLLKSLYVILISLGLALIFNFLFFSKLIGISVLIFTVILLITVFLFGRTMQLSIWKSWWQIALIVFFSLMPGIRDNEFLTFLNVCATFGLLMLLAYQLVGTPTFLMRLRDYFSVIIFVPFRMLRSAISTVSSVAQIHSNVKNRDIWIRVLKGVIMAVPVLILFGVLFSKADLAFSQFINNFLNISVQEETMQYLVLLVFAFIAGLSFLSYIFFPKNVMSSVLAEQSDVVVKPEKGIEVLVFLGLISTLFLIFIGFQLTYLFGGETNIINAGFTYAEYARRGFWELLAVSILSLLILLASEKYSGSESKKDKKFMIPALILITEVIIIIISAFKRLSLYIDTYGMTSLRFYVAGFIILLLVLFVILAVKFVRSKGEQFFTFGTLLSVAAFLMIVNIMNPDAYIIKSNIKHFEMTGKFDALYLEELSVDAVPGEIELYKKLQGEDKEALGELLLSQKDELQYNGKDWQSANLSRTQARKLLNEFNQ